MCGASGCCGVPPPCCRATTSASVAATTRAAFLLMALRCFIVVSVELLQERGMLHGELAVDLETGVGPAADPLAVVQVGPGGVAVAGVRLVVTAAAADRAGPALAAVGLVGDVVIFEERRLLGAVDALGHRAEAV